MKLEIQQTSDGSQTIYSDKFNETYHSVNGAITESNHVFIRNGLHLVEKPNINILEIGFGTGLNALLTLDYSIERNRSVFYRSIELYPLEKETYSRLSYYKNVSYATHEQFLKLHECPWNQDFGITDLFTLHKANIDILVAQFVSAGYDLIYFDAFSPNQQPELWSLDIFRKVFDASNQGAVLTTYCAKGAVRRNLKEAGFMVERLPGPPGKREMLRAVKH